jgi:hypothetical protein
MMAMKPRVRLFVRAGLYRGSRGFWKRPHGRPEGPNRYVMRVFQINLIFSPGPQSMCGRPMVGYCQVAVLFPGRRNTVPRAAGNRVRIRFATETVGGLRKLCHYMPLFSNYAKLYNDQ